MTELERQKRARMEDVAKAIGRVVCRAEVEPKGGWMEAAEAAIKAYHAAWVYSPGLTKNWPT